MSTTSQDIRSNDIRGVMIQVAGGRLLLPNATIAEVMSYADPEPIECAPGKSTPDWLLGRIRWRGWQLPLIAFARLSGIAEEQGGLGSKVIVLKALGGDPKFPYFALLTQGFPRLVTVSRDTLVTDTSIDEALPEGVQARVLLNENDALLPDLEHVEVLISQALRQAA
jgi:chemosensory pili system protein ChpC